MARYRGVILDVDGTLVDSNDAHAHAWTAALSEAGFAVPFKKVRDLIGMGGDQLLPEVTGLSDKDEQGKQITQRRGEIFQAQYLPKLNAFHHTRELLTELKRRGLTLVVASSATEKELDPLLDIAGATDLIEEKTSADDAEHSKPEPDLVLAALKTLGMSPHEAVMLGDTPYDVQACQKAGVDIIALRSGGWSAKDLAGAIAVYADCAELLQKLDDSPLGK